MILKQKRNKDGWRCRRLKRTGMSILKSLFFSKYTNDDVAPLRFPWNVFQPVPYICLFLRICLSSWRRTYKKAFSNNISLTYNSHAGNDCHLFLFFSLNVYQFWVPEKAVSALYAAPHSLDCILPDKLSRLDLAKWRRTSISECRSGISEARVLCVRVERRWWSWVEVSPIVTTCCRWP